MSRAFRPQYGFRPVTLPAPLAMPDQQLDRRYRDPAARAEGPKPSHSRLSRAAVLLLPPPFAVVFGMTTGEVLAADGAFTPADLMLSFLSGFAVYWMAMSVVSSFCGLFWRAPARASAAAPGLRIAILLPMYGEDPAETLSPSIALLDQLRAPGHGHRFSLHVLSDTRNGRAALEEAAMVAKLSANRPDLAITYRHRVKNTDYKQGNIRDWISRQGAAYDAALILDADSVMGRESVLLLADTLVADPGCGLVQTLPLSSAGDTVWQRLQSFASRVYGGPHGRGFAMWTGSDANFLGHNAMVRMKAFAACCGLPHLPGPRPMGGVIQSHDFVEAALLRRAGWGVRMLPAAMDSHEGPPGNLLAHIKRDARWCQGNLQHMRLLKTPGLHWVSRLHFLSGAMAYLGSVMLLVMLMLWAMAEQGRTGHASNGIEVVLAGTVIFLLFAPRFFGVFDYLRRVGVPKGRRLGFGKLLLAETAVAVLSAPVMMLHHTKIILRALTGSDTGWPQHSHGRIPLKQLAKFHALETLLGFALLGFIAAGSLSIWLLPVAFGLALAVPVSAWVSGPADSLAEVAWKRR
ncbi:glucans biosynthesis glucosyltransferase MdoH [Pseudogemmobacter faecipullorum]|uniref:Glucans biosynthesis glucosyltransferase H n=1 Tax=Pseudogemmobacter faecipullorum TaxID=2755041 RepID=A0ABS8CMM3_9RHOB|nr:glucans biosynthesis glucosyltransferase MdoH [Pseudogemmobacter faecipullorum]MCB5410624.1 glucans biosynthesis glucosyltransferase MdoH [Pseudogemmobacter faecipullorum]